MIVQRTVVRNMLATGTGAGKTDSGRDSPTFPEISMRKFFTTSSAEASLAPAMPGLCSSAGGASMFFGRVLVSVLTGGIGLAAYCFAQ